MTSITEEILHANFYIGKCTKQLQKWERKRGLAYWANAVAECIISKQTLSRSLKYDQAFVIAQNLMKPWSSRTHMQRDEKPNWKEKTEMHTKKDETIIKNFGNEKLFSL